MHLAPRRTALLHAFTLIELLVVIAIIAILMGLLLPVLAKVREQARNAQAKGDVTSIVAAVRQFHTDYGKYPQVSAALPSGDVLVGDAEAKATIDNSALFDTLRAIDRGLNERHALNPKRIVFFEGKTVSDPKEPRSGFADRAETTKRGCFYDPWGRQYGIVIDADNDNQLALTGQYSDFTGDNAPRVGVGAFSMGRDNQLGTKGDAQYRKGATTSDDVISWQ